MLNWYDISEHTDKYTAALTWMVMFRISSYFIHNMFQNIMVMAKVGGPVAYDVIYSKVVAKKTPKNPYLHKTETA